MEEILESHKVQRKNAFEAWLISHFSETPFTLTSQMTDMLREHFDPFVDSEVRAFVEVRNQRDFFAGQIMGALGGRLPHVPKMSDARVVYDALLPNIAN